MTVVGRLPTILGERVFTAKTYAVGSYVDGDFVRGAESTFEIRGALQEIQQRTVEQLPEGQRQSARWELWTHDNLTISREGQNTISDRVEVDGEDYIVIAFFDRLEVLPLIGRLRSHSVLHRKYVLARPETP